MKSIYVEVTDRNGTRHRLEGLTGWRLMEVIRDYDLPIKAECGGACACATCHVYVSPQWLDRIPPIQEEERDMLDEAFAVEQNSRLSCQIILEQSLEGLGVTLAPASEP